MHALIGEASSLKMILLEILASSLKVLSRQLSLGINVKCSLRLKRIQTRSATMEKNWDVKDSYLLISLETYP